MELTASERDSRRALEDAARSDIAAIKSDLARATTPDMVYGLLARLSSIPLPPGSKLAAVIAGITANASDKLVQVTVTDNRRIESYAGRPSLFTDLTYDTALSKAMFNHFTEDERRYFSSIDPTKNYKILSIDQNGNLIEGQSPREVTGVQLREDFARLKFHTLSPQEQQRVRQQTPAETSPANASPDSSKPSAEPAKPGTLQADKQEMQQLQESMTRLEGHEAQHTVERHGGVTDAARNEIRGRHQHFQRAREISGEIIDRVQQVETREAQVKGLESIAQIPIPMMPNIAAMALPIARENLEQEKRKAAEDIEKKREELGQTIQEDVINKGLLGKPQEPSQERSREQQPSVQVSSATDVKAGDAITPGNAMTDTERNNSRALT